MKQKINKTVYHEKKYEMNARNAGLTLGILGAAYTLILSIVAYFFGLGLPLVRIISSLHRGYELTIAGIIIGTLWAFVGGFALGYLAVWVYKKII